MRSLSRNDRLRAEEPLNTIIWDLETSNLDANFGAILCAGLKQYGEGRPRILSIRDHPHFLKDPSDDYWIVKAAAEVLAEADMWITWYGSRFDVPFLNSRLLYHHLPLLPPVAHWDGWRIARYKLKLHSNRLASVQDFLELPDAKTPLSGRQWQRARVGYIPALRYVEEHCKKDVLVLEEAYEMLKPLGTPMHANRTLVDGGGCPVCGHNKLQKRGIYTSRTRQYGRLYCASCGAWSKTSKALVSGAIVSL